MVDVGLIEKEDSKRKWTYYRLTHKGRSILHPHEMTKILVLLGSSILAFMGGVSQIIKSLAPSPGGEMRKKALSAPSPEAIPAPSPVAPQGAEDVLREGLILGGILIAAALLLGYYAYKIWRESRPEKLRVGG
jgi:hypothetical protein